MTGNLEHQDTAELSRPGLPQKTQSLCPECLGVLDALLYEHQDKVWMSKTCPEHGEFVELISSDAAFFKKMDQWEWDLVPGVSRHFSRVQKGCPRDCGLCPSHQSPAMMINIDLTNRCNLRCPVCFANAAVSGRLYEVTVEQVQGMMDRSVQASELARTCVQFSGGEPTLHRDFLEIIRRAKQCGYAQIQIASNGVKLADDLGFAHAASEAGLNVVYLQFDGVSDDVYLKTRGRALWETKERAVENIGRAGMQACLVPTLVRGVNDHQIGDIFRFAVEHSHVVTGISWQPVVFTGRIDYDRRLEMRFTIADLARELETQTDGLIKMYRDWYPLSFVGPFSKLVEVISGEPMPIVSCHRHCGAGTYVIIDGKTGRARPLPAFVDVEGLMERMHNLAETLSRKRWFKRFTLMRALNDLGNYFHADHAPDGWDANSLLEFMNSFVDFRQRYPDNRARLADLENRSWRCLVLVAMHFQDAYNYQLPRVRRCVIHYAAPDGKLYPFCTYNCGPYFRGNVEAQFSRPVASRSPKPHEPAPAAQTAGKLNGQLAGKP